MGQKLDKAVYRIAELDMQAANALREMAIWKTLAIKLEDENRLLIQANRRAELLVLSPPQDHHIWAYRAWQHFPIQGHHVVTWELARYEDMDDDRPDYWLAQAYYRYFHGEDYLGR